MVRNQLWVRSELLLGSKSSYKLWMLLDIIQCTWLYNRLVPASLWKCLKCVLNESQNELILIFSWCNWGAASKSPAAWDKECHRIRQLISVSTNKLKSSQIPILGQKICCHFVTSLQVAEKRKLLSLEVGETEELSSCGWCIYVDVGYWTPYCWAWVVKLGGKVGKTKTNKKFCGSIDN